MADTVVFMSVPEIEGTGTLVGTNPDDDSNHDKWIPVESCAFTFERTESEAVDPEGTEEDREEDLTTVVNPIRIERISDITSAQLLMWLAAESDDESRKKETVLVDYCSRSGKYFLRYELEGVELVSCSMSFQAPDEAKETLTLTYDKVTIYQRPIDKNGDVKTDKETQTEYTVFGEED